MTKHLYQYQFDHRQGLIFEWNGGFGEIAPLPAWSHETYEEAKEEILRFLFDQTKPTLPSVQCALFFAQKPFDPTRRKVRLSALHRPREGCSTLKLKIGHLSPQEAIALIQPFLGKYRLRLDINRKWTLDQALFFASHFSPLDFDYLEEPVSSIQELLSFSETTHFPIGVDESLRENPSIACQVAKVAIVKPTLMGHIPKLPIPVVLSSSYESSLGILQMAKHACENLAHGFDTFCDDLLDPPLEVQGGHLTWAGSQNPLRKSAVCLIASVP